MLETKSGWDIETCTKNADSLGHRDTKNEDNLGHRDTENADRLRHRNIKNI